MGQYYELINVSKSIIDPKRNYVNGLKLMESCYIPNEQWMVVSMLLAGPWNGDRFVHCGDYSPDAESLFAKAKEIEVDHYDRSDFPHNPQNYEDYKEFLNSHRLVNYSKKQYTDLASNDGKAIGGMIIANIPLLTASGNGLGLGDYSGRDQEKVGLWKMDSIGVLPIEDIDPEFKEVKFHFEFF